MPTLQDYAELLRGFRTAILTTRGPDGHFHSRPMAMRHGIRGEALWFATAADSQKCRDLRHDPHCSLTFYDDAGDGSYVSVSGRAELSSDRDLLGDVWDESWDRWFPDGPGQRDVCAIRIVPEHVEYMHPGRAQLHVLYTLRRILGDVDEPGPELFLE